jgi:hypothetical protein
MRWLDKASPHARAANVEEWTIDALGLLGQTALFAYLLHVHLLKLAGWMTGLDGRFGVGSAYLGAPGVLVALYPACAWYRRCKAAYPDGSARWI